MPQRNYYSFHSDWTPTSIYQDDQDGNDPADRTRTLSRRRAGPPVPSATPASRRRPSAASSVDRRPHNGDKHGANEGGPLRLGCSPARILVGTRRSSAHKARQVCVPILPEGERLVHPPRAVVVRCPVQRGGIGAGGVVLMAGPAARQPTGLRGDGREGQGEIRVRKSQARRGGIGEEGAPAEGAQDADIGRRRRGGWGGAGAGGGQRGGQG